MLQVFLFEVDTYNNGVVAIVWRLFVLLTLLFCFVYLLEKCNDNINNLCCVVRLKFTIYLS